MRLLNPLQESKFMEMKNRRGGSAAESEVVPESLKTNNDDDNESMKSTSLPHIKKEESN